MSFGNRTEEEEASKSFGNTPAWNSFLAVGYQRKEEKYSNKLERQLPFQKESNENGMFPLMQPEIASALQMYHEDYSEPSKMQSAQSTTFPTAQHCAGTFSSLCDQNRMFTPQNSISHYGTNVTFPSASSCLSNSPCTSENIVDIKNNICDEHPHLKKIDQPSLDDALGLTNAARWERSATSPAFPAQPDNYEVESDGLALAGGYAWLGLTPSAQGQHMNYQASQVQPCPPCYSKNMTYNIDAAQGHMDWHAPISPESCPRNQLLSADKSTTSHKADNQYPHSQLYTRPEVKVKPSQCSVILPDARAVYCPGLPETQFSLFSASPFGNPQNYYLHGPPPHSGPFVTTNMMASNCNFSFMPRKHPKGGVEVPTYLHLLLDSCYEQWKLLEKERKKAEVQLAEYYPGRNLCNSNVGQGLRLPPNPTKIDRLIVDQLREQAKVSSLFGKMEQLYSTNTCPIQLQQHLKAIYMLQASREEEIDHASRRLKPNDVCALILALDQLWKSTRCTRSVLWCRLQVIVYLTKNKQVQAYLESQN
uniref:meiosis-specific coiled-coil domain-containing protein MEIOC n=1 Tax=Myxine glutinosa TaxID=7769 RepID=UPI00358FC32B